VCLVACDLIKFLRPIGLARGSTRLTAAARRRKAGRQAGRQEAGKEVKEGRKEARERGNAGTSSPRPN